MIWWIVGVVSAVAAQYWFVTRRRGFFTAVGLFPLMQLLMAAGTYAILRPGDSVHDAYATVISLPLIVFCVASIALEYLTPRDRASVRDETARAGKPSRMMVLVLVGSFLITLAYFIAVGYNLFFWGIWNMLTPGSSDLDATSLRLRTYNGERYFAPGYVNQFKNVLLPITTLAFVHYLFKIRWRFRWLAAAGAVVALMAALLGTGQRGAFVLMALVVVAGIARYGRISRRQVLLVAALSAPAFLVATLLLGRSGQNYDGTSSVGRVAALLREVFDRFFYTNQASGYHGYVYTHDQPTQWGAEWWRALRGILPGDPGSDVSFKVFETVYGSDRGTMPLSLWGSVDYNFGLVGLVVIPVALAAAFHWFTVWSTSRETVNTLDGLAQAGIHVVLATWIAGGPEYLLNSGLLAFALALWVARRMHPATQAKRPVAEQGVDGRRASPTVEESGRPEVDQPCDAISER